MFRKFALLLWLVVLGALCGFAQLPKLIDRELFFGDPEISGAQISPDGQYITFLKPFKGIRNIWVKSRAEAFDKARPITADSTRPVSGYFWSLDSKYVLYVQDKGGDENFRIYAVDPKGAGDPVPRARDLTPMEKVRAEIIDVPRRTPDQIVIGLNDRRADLHDIYRLTLSTGEKKLLWKNDQNVAGWQTDLDGNLRLALRVTPSGGTEILRVGADSLYSIYSVDEREECSPIRMSPDGMKFYLETNKGDATDKSELMLYDLRSGDISLVEKDPLNEVDFGYAIFSDVTNTLEATVYVGDRIRVYPKEKKFAADWNRLKRALPAGEVSIAGSTLDENIWLVAVSSDVDPGSRYLFDRRSGKAELLYRSRPNLPSKDLAHVKPVRYSSRDGLIIPAYLTLPKGLPPKKLPTVMLIHGGPWARVSWGYNPEAQFLANRGYAVLMPNFRGSTGYGKKFLNAGNKQWGTGFMQHDISDGVKYLIKENIADPKRVAIYGGSYGGYATLAGLAFTPELYRAGISYVGPSNIITLLNSIPPYWAPMKKLFDVRVGDMSKPEERKMLESQSPLNSATKITAPLLVIQGANDPRVNKAESDRIVMALRDLGRTVEYMVAPDEGHGFAGRDNRMAVYTAMERFFAKELGGRYQESVPEEIQKKLDAITVDVKSVKAPPAVTEVAAPAPVFHPEKMAADTVKYAIGFTAMGQKMTMTVVRTLGRAELNGMKIWRAVDLVTGAMGSASDTVDMDGSTLLTVRRAATQGPGGMWLAFTSGEVKGKFVMQGKETPYDEKSSGTILSDGAGIDIPLLTLPLSQGYAAGVKVFDSETRKIREVNIVVTGKESVTTPAGAFDAIVAEVRPLDGEPGKMTYWISLGAPMRVVKTVSQMPAAMGGGLITAELTK